MTRDVAVPLLFALYIRQIGLTSAADARDLDPPLLFSDGSLSTADNRNASFLPNCPPTCSCRLISDTEVGQIEWTEKKMGVATAGSTPVDRGVKVVVCRDSGLRVPPQNLPSDTYSLDLSGNSLIPGSLVFLRDLYDLRRLVVTRCRIRTLEELFTGGQQLQWSLVALETLVLDNNELVKLSYSAGGNGGFVKMATLRSLSLANNRIDSIHPNAFSGLVQLEDLNLSNNRLFTLLDNQWMFFLPVLRRLNLSGNLIHTLHNSSFGHLSGICTLDLRANRLRQIHTSAFRGLYSLRELNLRSNNLTALPSFALSALNSLWHLDISENYLEEIAKGSFWNLSSLASLTLSRMKRVQIVDELSFVNLASLTRLEISGCERLAYIHRNAFRNVGRLETLVLHSNALEAVEEGVFRNLPSLTELDLHSNPFTCDCVMHWLVRKQKFLSLLNDQLFTCHSPAALKGVFVVDVPIDSLSEKCGPRVLTLFQEQAEVMVSDSVLLRCLAVGLPPPTTVWVLPHLVVKGQEENKAKVSSDARPDVASISADRLFIRSVATRDAGQYKCVATNPLGTDDRTINLRVKPSVTALVLLRIGSTSVTLTWKNMTQGREYRLTYQPVVNNQPPATAEQTTVVIIGRQMRTFTARNLPPKTYHEFCISVKVPPYKDDVPILYQVLNCTKVTTADPASVETGLYSAGPMIVATVVGVIAVVCAALGCVFAAARRYNRKRTPSYNSAGPRGSDFERFLDGAGGGFGDESSMANMSETYENETAVRWADGEGAIFDETDLDEIRRTVISMINPPHDDD